MSLVLINQYLGELDRLKRIGGTHRESVVREAFNSISASRPCASGSRGAIEVSTRPMRSASLQSCGRSHSSPRAAV